MKDIIETNCTFEAELRIKFYRPDGTPYWDTIHGSLKSVIVEEEREHERDFYGNPVMNQRRLVKKNYTVESVEVIG